MSVSSRRSGADAPECDAADSAANAARAPRPGLRERKKAATMHRIQAAALDLFERHGFDAVSIEQVADAAEVSPSTVYRYLSSPMTNTRSSRLISSSMASSVAWENVMFFTVMISHTSNQAYIPVISSEASGSGDSLANLSAAAIRPSTFSSMDFRSSAV